MRHSKGNRKLGKPTDQRLAMLRAIVRSLFLHGRVKVTLHRAKEARKSAEKLITAAKKNDLSARRKLEAFFGENAVVTEVFKTLPQRFEGRAGGFTRITRIGFRKGDAARMAVLELL